MAQDLETIIKNMENQIAEIQGILCKAKKILKEKKEAEKKEDGFAFQGKIYDTKGENPKEGCFLFIGGECAGFYFNGELDTEVIYQILHIYRIIYVFFMRS